MRNLFLAVVLLVACADDLAVTTSSTFDTTLGATAISAPTEAIDPTTGSEGEESTTGVALPVPIPVPPIGCGHFVEINARAPASQRWFTIDMSTCPRAALGSLRFEVDAPVKSSDDLLLPRRDCGTYGGDASPAAVDADGVLLDVAGNPAASAWRATLFVDGAVSDLLRVPVILQWQEWDDEPEAPATPVMRREDWAWAVTGEHVAGCGLLAP